MAWQLFQTISELGAAGLMWSVVKWTVAGVGVGTLVGVAVFLAIRAVGGYRLEIRWAKWLRVLAALFTIGLSAVVGGLVGAGEGVGRGAETMLRTGSLGTQVLPKAGKAGAILLAGIYCVAPDLNAKSRLPEELKAFEAGAWEINVAELDRRLDSVTKQTVRAVTQPVVNRFAGNTPGALAWLVEGLAHGLVRRELRSQLDVLGLGTYWDAIRRELPAEAARAGDPKTITCAELSALIARQGIAPVLTRSVRGLVRQAQGQAALVWAGLVALPVLALRVTHWLRERRRQAK